MCSLFADDCLLYRPIQSTDDQCIYFTGAWIEEWANKCIMIFNTDTRTTPEILVTGFQIFWGCYSRKAEIESGNNFHHKTFKADILNIRQNFIKFAIQHMHGPVTVCFSTK